jgi:mRNA-degrading endonuclease toxin of MazEF toxin-antitoxin module
MSLPEPERGLVICYSYLWSHEASGGSEEGRKNRPCVIIVSVKRVESGQTIVTVLPITHSEPDDLATAVEIPLTTKQRLGLDAERSWVMVDEANQFVWPGYDLQKIPGRDAYDYGLLPPRLFNDVLEKAREWLKQHGIKTTPR